MTDNRKMQIWLCLVCFMIFAMAVIGAVTRLTESGLSMVEWHPLIGWIPPLSESQWQHVYGLYKQSPEFVDKHSWMTLADFKHIFFWEWLHRLWGRTIGLVFALPLLYFWWRKKIPAGYGWRLAGLFLLGGAQGLLGWWMVESGLVNRPEVSHFRLAAHLALALFLLSATWWTALDLSPKDNLHAPAPPLSPPGRGLIAHGWGVLAFLAITIVWGAFTAGLDAGMIYNTWPLMGGSFTPPESFHASSIIEQQAWVQFLHRWLAFATGLGILGLAIRARALPLGIMVFIQIGLGISTLLSRVAVPLATLHQAGAIILLALLLHALHRLHRLKKENQAG